MTYIYKIYKHIKGRVIIADLILKKGQPTRFTFGLPSGNLDFGGVPIID